MGAAWDVQGRANVPEKPGVERFFWPFLTFSDLFWPFCYKVRDLIMDVFWRHLSICSSIGWRKIFPAWASPPRKVCLPQQQGVGWAQVWDLAFTMNMHSINWYVSRSDTETVLKFRSKTLKMIMSFWVGTKLTVLRLGWPRWSVHSALRVHGDFHGQGWWGPAKSPQASCWWCPKGKSNTTSCKTPINRGFNIFYLENDL